VRERLGGLRVVFRRDSKVDAFQRQISALRHQLGGEHDLGLDADGFASSDFEHVRSAAKESDRRADYSSLTALETFNVDSDIAGPITRASLELDRRLEEMSLPAVPAIDGRTSVVAHTTSWSGNLESQGSLHVHGRVEGSLTASDDVFIAEEAEVDAVISASKVTVAGLVRGSIVCSDRFEILPRGRVAGDVRSPVLVIHEGALIAGDIAMSAPESRAAPAAARPARAARGGD
jgi:cytoskeletal protein CcmA (bactofilin family)